MAIALVFGISYLIAEFLAHAIVFLGILKPAGAVAAFLENALANLINDLSILIQTNSHWNPFRRLSNTFASIGQASLLIYG